MKYTHIPKTDIKVSKICLGTMTFGEQNTEAQAHEQLNFAVSKGVNFIDTAEMYSVPGRKETQGSTERFIGSWLKDQKREDLVVATKVTGPNPGLSYIREPQQFSKELIHGAIENNLRRLQTDYIDVYQLHWPDRKTNFFGKLNYKHEAENEWVDNINITISALDDLVKQGKIRHYGLSNETPWGVMRHLQESDQNNLTRCKTIQNPYSLLNRTYEVGLAEVGMREEVGLLAYSPLAFGVLSGKYLEGGNATENDRVNKYPQFSRYNSEQSAFLTQQYANLAKELGLSLTHLALAFVNHQPWVTANIIGATKIEQLQENIASIDVELSDEVLTKIDEIQKLQPNPAP
ncbi:aldo/keto reductase [Wenyingzhuangia fucanilytica]|uniref:Protein tas n=1 Tax=Wenyingzhuangia fucanilytica TaxID=1790137 RepID=A0A1B1Y935_9FLAO|nr:aldo/keto reductase [Wenyingzhuangia fucanilytica]ANW97229.1 aldo/keto reductase [Wenyingzhuangia fucanilytica]